MKYSISENTRPFCYTDYPILPLGDESGKKAPIRRVWPIAYDGDKYVIVLVSEGGKTVSGWIKRSYLYREPMRSDKADNFKYDVSHLKVEVGDFLSVAVDWS